MGDRNKQKFFTNSTSNGKKKPPPRPPPPNFSKYKSKSTYNLNQKFDNISLIEWSPPSSPINNNNRRNHPFSGSVSSSFSSSTSSLASSKKSLEYEIPPPVAQSNSNFYVTQNATAQSNSTPKALNVPTIFGPTIIRAQPPKPKPNKNLVQSGTAANLASFPMPMVPPPSPPKCASDIETPYGIALFDFPASQATDLPLQVDDVVILIRQINSEWLYGRVLDREGMFPANFIEIKVPLQSALQESYVTALYEFRPQQSGDLELKPGQKVRVIRKVSDEWLYGESNGNCGVFPYNFVDKIPKNI